jgi:hypothetical protein
MSSRKRRLFQIHQTAKSSFDVVNSFRERTAFLAKGGLVVGNCSIRKSY